MSVLVHTGPKSAAGKAAAARNSRKHGLTSLLPVLPGVESEAKWQAHLAGITRSLLPQTHIEQILVERIALLLWRLRRVARYEREVTAAAHEELEAYYTSPSVLLQEATRAAEWECLPGRGDAPLSHAGLLALLGMVPNLPGHALLRRQAVLAVLDALAAEAGGLDLPPILAGLGGYDDPTREDGWTADMLAEAVRRLAAKTGENWLTLKQKALRTANSRIAEAQAEGRQRFLRARAAELLPEPDILDRVIRYEAHLNRQLLAALHELEAIQARRAGEPAPLARLDINTPENA